MARNDCEKFMGTKVYLRCWVKVKENWRDSDFMLKNFGYRDQQLPGMGAFRRQILCAEETAMDLEKLWAAFQASGAPEDYLSYAKAAHQAEA